jgi:ATP-binding cassette subfamily D (ALD) long-chain fatty acid import protein
MPSPPNNIGEKCFANLNLALITISTRASLKKYHTYHLILTEGSEQGSGSGSGGVRWELQRVGTETEKMHARRELEELREKLAQVEKWKARHAEIERELGKVWVEGGEEPMPPPAYVAEGQEGDGVGGGVDEHGDHHETEAEETQDEADYQEAQEEMGDETETEAETLITAEGQGDGGSAAGEGSGVVV